MQARYPLPPELARHVPGREFAPEDLQEVCREAGEGLGREDAGEARFRSAAEMVALWRGLDLPAWEAPYALRAARLGYISGYGARLLPGALPESTAARAAEARWGEEWPRRLAALRERSGEGAGGTEV